MKVVKIILWILLLPFLPFWLGWKVMRSLQKKARPDAKPEAYLFFSAVAFIGTVAVGYMVMWQVVAWGVLTYNKCFGDKTASAPIVEQASEQNNSK